MTERQDRMTEDTKRSLVYLYNSEPDNGNGNLVRYGMKLVLDAFGYKPVYEDAHRLSSPISDIVEVNRG